MRFSKLPPYGPGRVKAESNSLPKYRWLALMSAPSKPARWARAAARAVSSSARSISASVTMQLSGRGASFSKSGLLQAMRGAGTPSGLE